MSRDLDYLIVGVDISKKNLEKRLKQAEERITQSSNADKLSEAYLKKGQILQKLGKYRESKKPLKKAIKLAQKKTEAFIRLGNVYDEESKFRKAINYYEKGLRYCDQYAYGWCMLGLARFHWAQSHQAYLYNNKFCKDNYYDDYDKAIEIDKDCFLAYELKGYAYYHEGKFDKAIENYNKAIKIDERDVNAYHTLGEIYAAKGNFGMAFEYYMKSSYYTYHKDHIEKIDIKELGKDRDKDKYKDFPYSFKKFIYDLMQFNVNITNDYEKLLGSLYALWHLSSLDNQEKKSINPYIYQYTSFKALEQIIKKRSLRLSPANYQNDPKEGKAFFEKIEGYIQKNKRKDVVKWLAKIKSKSTEEGITTFICCFSGNPDYIPMWNSSYGCNGEGCAIGIDRAKIRKPVLKNHGEEPPPKKIYENQAELCRVIYVEYKNQSGKKNLGENGLITADNLLKGIADCLQSIFDSVEFKFEVEKRKIIINALAELFSQIAHTMKYDDYEIENEYRLIYTEQRDNVRSYIHNEDGIYLYTEPIVFSKNSEGRRRVNVLLGPAVVGEIKRFKIEHQTESKEYDVKVKHSKVPYRKT